MYKEPDLVLVAEIARRVGLAPATLQRMGDEAREGVPPVIRLGRRNFFRRDMAEAWLDAKLAEGVRA